MRLIWNIVIIVGILEFPRAFNNIAGCCLLVVPKSTSARWSFTSDFLFDETSSGSDFLVDETSTGKTVDDVIIQAPTTQRATNRAMVVVVQKDEDGDEGRLASIFEPLPNAISPTLACTGSPALNVARLYQLVDRPKEVATLRRHPSAPRQPGS